MPFFFFPGCLIAAFKEHEIKVGKLIKKDELLEEKEMVRIGAYI